MTDKAGLMKPAEISYLEDRLKTYKETTSNDIIVYTAPTLDGENMEEATTQWLHDWGVGKKGKGNGLGLFVFKSERKNTIRTGYGLEGALPDATCKAIADGMRSHFRAGNFGDGIKEAVDKLIKAIDNDAAGLAPEPIEKKRISGWVIFFVIVLVILLVICLAASTRGSGGSWSGGSSSWDSSSSSSGGSGGSGWSGGGGDFGGGGGSSDW